MTEYPIRDAYGREDRRRYGNEQSYGRGNEYYGRGNERPYGRGNEHSNYRSGERSRDYSPGRKSQYDKNFRRRDHQDKEPIGSKEDYLLTHRDYSLQLTDRRNRGGRSLDEADVDARYEIYRTEFMNSKNEKFFKEHSTEEWLKEKYHPTLNVAFLAQVAARKKDCLQDFESDLISGKFDNVNFNEGEPFDDMTKIGFDLNENETSKGNSLFITGISIDIKRTELIEVFQKVPGFKYLELSEPKLEKMVRFGWIIFESETTMRGALDLLQDVKVGEKEQRLVIVESKGIRSNVRSYTGHTNNPARLTFDLEEAKKLCVFLDKEAGFEEGLGFTTLINYVEPLLQSIPENSKEVVGDEAEKADDKISVDGAENDLNLAGERKELMEVKEKTENGLNISRITKQLDLLIFYLHRVHFYDYYSQVESTGPEDHTRRGCYPTRKEFANVNDRVEPYWLKILTSTARISPSAVQDLELQIDKELSQHLRKEAESKFRCIECQKLFRGDDFVRKHIRSKHPTLIEHFEEDVAYYNNFCAKAKPETKPKTAHSFRGEWGDTHRERGTNRGDRSTWGSDREVREEPRPYQDLDAQTHQTIELNYD